MNKDSNDELGTAQVSRLLLKFAIPSIISMLVSALYNMVDQLFIGQGIGTDGNAATNIAFPFSTICIAAGLLFGVGGASSFNLTMGRGDSKRAGYYIGNALTMLAVSGTVLSVITLCFLTPLLKLCGSPDNVLPYAKDYNYDARNYDRVKKAFKLALTAAGILSVCSFAMFELIPKQILSLFGTGSQTYFAFGERFLRIFLCFTGFNCFQPLSSTFFTSIGKPVKGVFLSLTRQIIVFLPVLLILPIFIEIDGIIYAGPIADLLAAIVSVCMTVSEFKNISKLKTPENAETA